MNQSLRFFLRYTAYALSVVIILIALVLQSARLLTPHLYLIIPSIESFVSNQTQTHTTIGHIEGRWHGLTPHIMVSDVELSGRIIDSDIVPSISTTIPLSVEYIEMKVDLLASLFQLGWEWKEIVLRNAHAAIKQDQSGQWTLAKIPLFADSPDKWEYHDLIHWAKKTPDIHIENILVNVTPIDGETIQFTVPEINTETSEDNSFQRLSAAVHINNQPALSFVVEHQPFSDGRRHSGVNNSGMNSGVNQTINHTPYAKGFLSVSDFSLSIAEKLLYSSLTDSLQEFLQKDQRLAQTYINGTLWFDFLQNDTVEFSSTSKAIISSVYLNAQQPIVLNTLLQGKVDGNGLLQIGLDQLTIDGEFMLGDVAFLKQKSQSTLQIETVVLQSLTQWVESRFLLPSRTRKVLEALTPQGELQNLTFEINHKLLAHSTLSATVKNVAVNEFEGIPAMGNVSGYIESQWLSGFINIDSKKFRFFPKKIYDEPVILDQFSGQVAWTVDRVNNKLIINSNYMQGAAVFGEGVGEFLLDLPLGQDSRKSDLSFHIGLKNSEVKYQKLLIPNKVPRNIREWLADSLQTGVIKEAGVVYRGGLSGDEKTRSYQMFADVNEASLDYSQDWPALENVSGRLLVDNEFLHVSSRQVEVFQEPLELLSMTWPGDGRQLLNVRSVGRLSAKTGLRMLTETTLKESIGNSLDGADITGDVKADIDLWVQPKLSIGNVSPAASTVLSIKEPQSVKIEFLNNDASLSLPSLPALSISSLTGQFSYSIDNGLQADSIAMQVFGEPLILKLNTVSKPLSLPGKQLIVEGEGIAPVSKMMEWLGRPELQFFNGVTPYQFTLSTPFRLGVDDAVSDYSAASEITISSSLQGVAINLPEPFKKDAVSSRKTIFSGGFSKISSEYRLAMDENVLAEITQKGNEMSGFLSINKPLAAPVTDNVFVISANIESFFLDEWLNETHRFNFLSNSNKSQFIRLLYDVSVDSMHIKQHEISDIRFKGERAESQWRTQIVHELVNGEVTIHDDKTVPTNIHLNYVDIPGKTKKAESSTLTIDPLENIDLSWLKPTDVTIEQLRYNNKYFGQWSFSINPLTEGIEFHNIHAAFNNLTLQGKTAKEGARLFWQTQQEKVVRGTASQQQPLSRTRFKGQLHGEGVQGLFAVMEESPVLTSQKTFFDADFSWAGSPAAFSISGINGTLGVDLSKGVFIQGEGGSTTGVLRFLGLFNFNKWARRLQLDFSDVYRKGLSYDELTAELVFDQGNIYFQHPLIVKAPSSEFTMAGKIDYKTEEIDAILVTTLPVGGNLTFATALVAGLPAALGVFIINKIFKSQVDKVSSLTYSVKGEWSEPEMKFINIFDDDLYANDSNQDGSLLNEPGIN
jgi:uncharacterized protein (TIGR02099 family)